MNWFMLVLGIGILIYSVYNLKVLKRDERYKWNRLFYLLYALLGACSIAVGVNLFSLQINEFLVWAMLALHIIALFTAPKKDRDITRD